MYAQPQQQQLVLPGEEAILALANAAFLQRGQVQMLAAEAPIAAAETRRRAHQATILRIHGPILIDTNRPPVPETPTGGFSESNSPAAAEPQAAVLQDALPYEIVYGIEHNGVLRFFGHRYGTGIFMRPGDNFSFYQRNRTARQQHNLAVFLPELPALPALPALPELPPVLPPELSEAPIVPRSFFRNREQALSAIRGSVSAGPTRTRSFFEIVRLASWLTTSGLGFTYRAYLIYRTPSVPLVNIEYAPTVTDTNVPPDGGPRTPTPDNSEESDSNSKLFRALLRFSKKNVADRLTALKLQIVSDFKNICEKTKAMKLAGKTQFVNF